MGPQALSTCAQWKEESFFKKKSITEDTNEKGSNNTNTGKVGKGAEPHSRGCSAPGTGPAAEELICVRELQHLDGLQTPYQNPILISPIRVLSESVILSLKTLYKEFQSFHDRVTKQRAPTFDLTPELTCSHPTTWDRYRAPANKPLHPRQKPRKVASLKKLPQTLSFRKSIPSC